jgi:hypothetical protein
VSADPNSILTMTKHKEEDAFTVDAVLRNFPPIDDEACRAARNPRLKDHARDYPEVIFCVFAARPGILFPARRFRLLPDDSTRARGPCGPKRSRSFSTARQFLLQNCATQRNAAQIRFVRSAYKKQAVQRREKLRKNSLGD